MPSVRPARRAQMFLPVPPRSDAGPPAPSQPRPPEGVIRRLKVLGIGLLLGAAFSLWVAGPVMPSGMAPAQRARVWAAVMGGPFVGTAWGMTTFYPAIGLGWLGLLLAPAHPLRPSPLT